MVPWVISKEPTNFLGMIQFLLCSEKDENLSDNWVPGWKCYKRSGGGTYKILFQAALDCFLARLESFFE
jgi:hypothetical protein